jgi:hypothetical protein
MRAGERDLRDPAAEVHHSHGTGAARPQEELTSQMPRRGLSDRFSLKDLAEANERAVQKLRVTRDPERTNGASARPTKTEPGEVRATETRATESDRTPEPTATAEPTLAATEPTATAEPTLAATEPTATAEPTLAATEPTASGAERTPGAATEPETPITGVTHPNLAERARWLALVTAKVITIAFAVDAFVNPTDRRFKGKAMRVRAIGYIGTLFVVPIAWRLLPDRGRYPRGLDAAVTVPLLLDAAGNSLGIYEDAHVDDVVHVANAAIVSGVAGALLAPQVDERWQAALAAAGLGITGETLWEVMEYVAWRLGADGLNLSYSDTMDDIIESSIGAIIGGLFTLTRVPRSREARKRAGWRAPLGA